MTKVARVTTFNVNQFSTPAHQQADLIARMVDSDTVLCQETVNLDLVLFVQGNPAWGAFQIRHSSGDGHANTGVLYRLTGGKITATDCTFLVDTKGERRRYLTAVQQGGVWYGSAHINPKRFSTGIPTQLAHIGAWVKAHPGPVILGLDRNQCPPGALENATGLKWTGVGIDGFLTNLELANVAEFPKGFSDHPGVHADVTLPGRHQGDPVTPPPKRLTIMQRIRKLLRIKIGLHDAGEANARDALKDLNKPLPKPDPPKPHPVPTTRHGFMPGAIDRNIAPGSNDPGIDPCGVVQHIAVSNADSLFDLFSSDNGIESHFYIRKDGTIEQYRSIFFEADAQASGNSFGSPRKGFVSVEHQGGVGADLTKPMPPAQLDAFHSVVAWVHSQRPFPLRVCPAWNAEGVGFHALFPEWNPNHHSCPGAARIKQFHDVTVPWLKSGAKV